MKFGIKGRVIILEIENIWQHHHRPVIANPLAEFLCNMIDLCLILLRKGTAQKHYQNAKMSFSLSSSFTF